VYQSEEALILQLKANNDLALSILYKDHFPMILNFILNNNGSRDDARDVYQEAVIIFYEKIQSGNLQLTCKIKTYLYSVCRRLWLKRLTEKRKFTGGIEDSEKFIRLDEEEGKEDDETERLRLMGASLEQLGEPCRTLINDFYVHELNMEEIAEKFGYTNPDNAKNQKYKCLKRLKKLFFDSYKNI
jgi:RNA polymerase sigma factor (sigma-70 family)